MLTNEAYTQFCDFWTAYRPADKYANRRIAAGDIRPKARIWADVKAAFSDSANV